jgi:hypothetical protein
MQSKSALQTSCMLVLLACISCGDGLADEVLLANRTDYGTVLAVDGQSLTLALGCDRKQVETIAWADVDAFGGVKFNDLCNGPVEPRRGGGTAACEKGQTTVFTVSFKEAGNHVYANSVALGADRILKITLANAAGEIKGPITLVDAIYHSTQCSETVDAAKPSWPAQFTKD